MLTATYLTPEEIGQRLNVSGWTVRRWIKDGLLEGYRVGGRLRVSEEAYEAFKPDALREQAAQQPAEAAS